MPVKTSDAQAQQRMRDAGKARTRQRLADLQTLLEQSWGRRLAYWLVYGDPAEEHPPEYIGLLMAEVFETDNALLAAKRDGARLFAIELHQRLEKASPAMSALMVRERLEARVKELALADEIERQSYEGDQNDE